MVDAAALRSFDRRLEGVQVVAEGVARVAAYIGGAFLVVSALIVTFDVVTRKLFLFSIAGADELSGYALAASMSWGYAYALFCRAHIRVDALYVRLPIRIASVLDVLSLLLFAGVIGLANWHAWFVLSESIRMDAVSGTPLTTPMWIPQSVWLAGMLFFLLCILLVMLRSIALLVAGDLDNLRRIAGAPSVQDEIESEIQHAPASPSPVVAERSNH
ncbi:MAG: TRAP transporter small permease [Acetobacterales bacterium]